MWCGDEQGRACTLASAEGEACELVMRFTFFTNYVQRAVLTAEESAAISNCAGVVGCDATPPSDGAAQYAGRAQASAANHIARSVQRF